MQREGHGARVIAFAVSCRALGRGIEDAFLAELADDARKEWDCGLVATVEDTGRNEPAKRFFATKGASQPGVSAELHDLVCPPYVRHRTLQ